MAKKICLVEDTPDLLKNFTEFLQMEGFEVWPCKGGAEALQRMETETPDLIITDLWMPAMDGLVFIDRVRRNPEWKKLPIVIFSAKALKDYEDEANALGVHHFIKKPAALDEILNVINPLLNP
jgi:CheY-like chemotaxis protein